MYNTRDGRDFRHSSVRLYGKVANFGGLRIAGGGALPASPLPAFQRTGGSRRWTGAAATSVVACFEGLACGTPAPSWRTCRTASDQASQRRRTDQPACIRRLCPAPSGRRRPPGSIAGVDSEGREDSAELVTLSSDGTSEARSGAHRCLEARDGTSRQPS